jgi:hypothetical protein
MTDALPGQLRALAALVERVEATTSAGIEVQAAQPAGVDPDGDLLRADLTVVVPTDGLRGAPTADESPADDVEGSGPEPEADADAEESEDASLAELTDTVRGDVLAVVKHGQSVESRADDRDVTTHAINHNLRVAREELNVNDLELVVTPTESERGAAEGQEEAPEWAMADGGAAAAQTAARVECQGCGATVSRDYARVFSPDNVDGVRTCPDCPDLIREGDGTVRKKRSGPHAVSSEESDDVQ